MAAGDTSLNSVLMTAPRGNEGIFCANRSAENAAAPAPALMSASACRRVSGPGSLWRLILASSVARPPHSRLDLTTSTARWRRRQRAALSENLHVLERLPELCRSPCLVRL